MKSLLSNAILGSAAIASMMCLSSCTQEEFTIPINEGKEMTIIATIKDTKTTNDGISTYWAQNDKASLIHCQSGTSDFYSSCFTCGSDGLFTGTSDNTSASNDWYFVYPYSSSNTSANTVLVNVSSVLTQNGINSTAHLCGENFPIFGVSKGMPVVDPLPMSLSNALSVGKIVITNASSEPVKVKEIEFTSSQAISGKFTVDLTSEAPIWTADGSAGNTVILTVSGNGSIPANSSAAFYIGLIPHISTSETVTVTAEDASSNTYDITVKRNNSEGDQFRAGMFKVMKITFNGIHNLENQSVSEYLNEAASKYTDANYTSVTIVKNYVSGQSSTNRKDAPAPVSLSWSTTIGGNKTVYIYNDDSMTDLETSVTTSTNKADILNLIPGRQYWYSVSSAGGTKVAGGSFRTEGRRRMLLVSNTRAKGHANNCRDLGGLKTTDGKTLKYGILFRGSNIDMATDEEKRYILGYMNVGLDVDLRSDTASYTSEGEDGIATAHNPWTGSWSGKITYCNDGAFTGTFSESFKVGAKDAEFTQMFTQILNTIRTGKAAYLHCHVGADRTGYVCLILESALGVSAKDCSIDFELTSFSVVGNRLRTGDWSHNMCKDALKYINNYSKGKTYQEKAWNILLDYGITEAQLQEFKSIMLE